MDDSGMMGGGGRERSKWIGLDLTWLDWTGLDEIEIGQTERRLLGGARDP